MRNRDNSISAVRCIAMCFIIACHILQYYDSILAWWLNVGVQIFFIVSGFLYSKKDISKPINWIGKQFKKILIPYYIYIFIVCISYFFIGIPISLYEIIKSVLCISTFNGNGHLWFVKYILFCYLITPYLYILKKWLFDKTILKSLLYLSAILIIYNIIFLPTYTFNPIWISCYILGYFYGAYSPLIKNKTLTLVKYSIIIIGFLMNFIRVYIKYFSSEINLFSSRIFRIYEDTSHLMLGFTLFFILYSLFKNIKMNNVLSFSDKYSYHIYLVHHLFILSPLTLMNVSTINFLNCFIVLIMSLISAVLLHKFVNNITNARHPL